MNTSFAYREVYEKLFSAYGPRRWWPGDSAFEIMVGAVLTQNTAWINVEKAIANLKRARMLSATAIVETHPRRVASLIRSSGYFNVKAKRLRALCRWIVAEGGLSRLARMSTEELRRALLAVHGIGPETADDILLYAFERPVFVIDAYTRRVFARLGAIKGPEPYEALRQAFEVSLGEDVPLYNEYHALIVLHGKEACRRKPLCHSCCLATVCFSRTDDGVRNPSDNRY
jgi:endonuclease-3 related protein